MTRGHRVQMQHTHSRAQTGEREHLSLQNTFFSAMAAPTPRGASRRTLNRGTTLGSGLFGSVGGTIYADQLASELREGDVILFKGKHAHDNAIRCCTASDYNHVALVVENGGELELFESTAVGVGCVPLEFYINSYYWSHMRAQFHKVVVRKLTTAEGRGISRRLRVELIRYQEEMVGRKFKLNPLTYMQALLSLPHREDMSSTFCSQLAAGAYKRMGLLPPEPAASSYFPRDFSTRSPKARLPLLNGARLGRELTLKFEDTPTFGEESVISSGSRPLPSRQPSMAATLASALRASVSLGSTHSLAASLPPTEEEEAKRRADADAMLRRAMAVYTVRACARRWLRRREREKERRLRAEVSPSAPPAAMLEQIKVDVRRDE